MTKIDKKDKPEAVETQSETSKIVDESKNTGKNSPNKSHFMRNLTVFVLLLLGGYAAFAAVMLKQNEKQSKNTLNELKLSYEQKLYAVNTKINELQNEVDGLKKRPAPTFNGVSEEYVNQRFMQLQQELLQSHSSAEGEPLPQLVLPTSQNAAPSVLTTEILLASGALIVQDLAEQNNSFEYETEVLRILAQNNPQAEKYVDTMQKFAVSGVQGKNKLIKSFNKIFADLNMANTKPQQNLSDSQNWREKIWSWTQKMLISKKGGKRPVFNEKEDEVYTLVNEGDLGNALNALKTSEKYQQMDSSPLMHWQKQAEEYLEFKHAVSGLIMNSLANLHLKEMEH